MAKSLRSKFKRKMRSLARTKKAPKEDARLEKVIARRTVHELEEAAKESEAAKCAPGTTEVQEMDTATEKLESTLNVKTMKTADGKYPAWLNQGKKSKMAKVARQSKKAKQNKTKGRR